MSFRKIKDAMAKVTYFREDAARDEEGRKQQGRQHCFHRAPQVHRDVVRTRDRTQRKTVVWRAICPTAVESEPPFRPPHVWMCLRKMSMARSWKNTFRRNETVNLRGAAASRGCWLVYLRQKPASPHTTPTSWEPESAFSCREEATIKGNVSESQVIIDMFLFINMIGWLNISRHLFCFKEKKKTAVAKTML